MHCMLDTDTLIYVLNARPQHQQVLDRFNQHDPREVCLSSITPAELRFGAAHRQRRDATQAKLDRIAATDCRAIRGPCGARLWGAACAAAGRRSADRAARHTDRGARTEP
jgi:predicted nucleic acid-binding protein